jgi:coniferyl-aldehyde dehydrogenase
MHAPTKTCTRQQAELAETPLEALGHGESFSRRFAGHRLATPPGVIGTTNRSEQMTDNSNGRTNDTNIFRANLEALIRLQRAAYWRDGVPNHATRAGRLQRMAAMLAENRNGLAVAISEDFGHRSHDETCFEIFGAVSALRSAATKVERWMQPDKYAPMAPDAEARVEYMPVGVVGVIGPSNFPIMTVFGPLTGIVAAGNRAVVKPSEFTPATSELLTRLIRDRFEDSEIAVVLGGAEEGATFAASPFDHLVFTGSTSVARHVMQAAAANLTPVTLELGGKSPVIIAEQFDLAEAAARVMTVKTRSAGQICLAPDYALVPAGRERDFAVACVAAIKKMFLEGVDSDDYTSIISDSHYRRLDTLVADARAKGAESHRSAAAQSNRQCQTVCAHAALEPARRHAGHAGGDLRTRSTDHRLPESR